MWIRDHDLVLVALWDFQSDKVDIIWRYIAAHAERLEHNGYLTNLGHMVVVEWLLVVENSYLYFWHQNCKLCTKCETKLRSGQLTDADIEGAIKITKLAQRNQDINKFTMTIFRLEELNSL